MLSVDLDLVEVNGAPADPDDPGVLIMKLLLPHGDPGLKVDEAVWLRLPIDGGRTYAAGDAIPGQPHKVAVANYSVEKATDTLYGSDRDEDGFRVLSDPQLLMHAAENFPDVVANIEVFCAVSEG